jgi:hypothetical protein
MKRFSGCIHFYTKVRDAGTVRKIYAANSLSGNELGDLRSSPNCCGRSKQAEIMTKNVGFKLIGDIFACG